MGIRKVGLVDSMRVSEKKSLRIARRMNPVGFLDSTRVAIAGLNHPTELCKTICLDLIQVKPLDRSAAGLNHLVELLPTECRSSLVHRQSIPGGGLGSKADVACLYYLVLARVTYCESINNN